MQMIETDQTTHREPSVGELVHDIAELASTLVRGEIALARLEMRDTVARSGAAIALFLVAAFLAMAGIVFVLIAMMLLLSPLVGSGWAALIETVLLFVAAALTASAAKKKLAPEPPAPAERARTAPSPALPPAKTQSPGGRS
jgi:uncharacterized membrane protein YqjE